MTEPTYLTIRHFDQAAKQNGIDAARLAAIGMAVTESLNPRGSGVRFVGKVDGAYVVGRGTMPACELIGCAKDGRWLPVKGE